LSNTQALYVAWLQPSGGIQFEKFNVGENTFSDDIHMSAAGRNERISKIKIQIF